MPLPPPFSCVFLPQEEEEEGIVVAECGDGTGDDDGEDDGGAGISADGRGK